MRMRQAASKAGAVVYLLLVIVALVGIVLAADSGSGGDRAGLVMVGVAIVIGAGGRCYGCATMTRAAAGIGLVVSGGGREPWVRSRTVCSAS